MTIELPKTDGNWKRVNGKLIDMDSNEVENVSEEENEDNHSAESSEENNFDLFKPEEELR